MNTNLGIGNKLIITYTEGNFWSEDFVIESTIITYENEISDRLHFNETYDYYWLLNNAKLTIKTSIHKNRSNGIGLTRETLLMDNKIYIVKDIKILK